MLRGLYVRVVLQVCISGSNIKPMIQAWIFRLGFETDPSNGVGAAG